MINIRAYLTLIFFILVTSIITTLNAQVQDNFFNRELIFKSGIKQISYHDTTSFVVDSFDKLGNLRVKRCFDQSDKLVYIKVFEYQNKLLSKVLTYKVFPEFSYLKETGDEQYFYDTSKQNRLTRIVGHDWGRYIKNNIISLNVLYFYKSDTIINQQKLVDKMIHANYIYDSQDTIVNVVKYNYDGQRVAAEELLDKSEQDVKMNTYYSFSNKDNKFHSAVIYVRDSHSPTYQRDFKYNSKGLLESVTDKDNQSSQMMEQIKYEYIFY